MVEILIYTDMHYYVEVNKMEAVEVKINMPKEYMERLEALYTLSGKDPYFEPHAFIVEAIRTSLEAYVEGLGLKDSKLEPMSAEPGKTGKASQ